MAVLLFGITLGLFINLQDPKQSLSDAVSRIKSVQQAVEEARDEIPVLIAKAVALAEKLDVPVIALRSSSRQVHRPNSSTSAVPDTYYSAQFTLTKTLAKCTDYIYQSDGVILILHNHDILLFTDFSDTSAISSRFDLSVVSSAIIAHGPAFFHSA